MKAKPNPFRTCMAVSTVGLLALAGQSARADYASTVLSYNPSAYWRLNETTPVPAADPAANSGTVAAAGQGYYLLGVTHPVTGIPGAASDGAATVPNVNNNGQMRIRVPFQPDLNQAGPFTAEFWAKPSQAPSTTGSGTCPYASCDFPNARGWLFYQGAVVPGQWTFRVYKGGTSTTINGGTVTSNEWTHVVGVYDGANISLYVNGQLVAGPTSLGGTYAPVTDPNIPLSMGSRGDGASGWWSYSGDMDEVVLYTNIVSDTDILAHYQAGTNPATADYSGLITTNNPVGYWRLDDPALTLPVAANSGSLGASAQGVYRAGMTNGVAGPGYSGLGGATVAAFNGFDGYVNCGKNVPDLSTPLTNITILTWAQFSAARAMNWEAIVTCGDTAWELQRPDNDYGVNFRFAGKNLNTPSTTPINDGFWHHIAATYDGAQQKIYIDGTLVASANLSVTNAGETTYPLLIGENGQWSGRVFKGNLAEVAVFTNALSGTDIQAIYNAAQVPPTITSEPASLMQILGSPATFTVHTVGAQPLFYQWYRGGNPISGATSASLTLPPVQWADNGATFYCTISNSGGFHTNSATATLHVIGEFAAMSLPESGSRTRHTALGSDGANLYFTRATGAGSTFYKMPEGISDNWSSLATIPLPTTWDNDSGVGDMSYYGGALWTLARNNMDTTSARAVYHYDITTDTWTAGSKFTGGDGPNTACAVIDTSHIMGGWIGFYPVKQVTDWQNGVYSQVADLAGGAVHPWDSCVGPDNVYFLKHYNVETTPGVLVSINKTGTPTVTSITGLPFNPGMGCAIEYMPGSLFSDGHARLYVLRGGTGTGDNDGQGWTAGSTTNQLADYDLVTGAWNLQTLPFAVDVGSEMALVNQTLYVVGANSEAQPLKVLYLGPPVQPIITAQPVSQTIYFGQSATFSASVYGGGPYNYQWSRNGAAIPGATGNTLTIANADYTDAANYAVSVSNSAGSTNSDPASLTVLPLPAYANLTNGLVIHLKFEGDYTDSSGNANDGTAFGSPAFISGKLGQGLELSTDTGSGIYNYVQVYDLNSQFEFAETNSFSIAFWLKYTVGFTDLPIIGNASHSTYNPGYVITEDHDQLEWTFVGVDTGSVIADPVGGPLLNDGAWHQITVVFDRDQQLAMSYVDGALIDTRSIAGVGSMLTYNALTIGQDPTGTYANNGTFDLDDVGVWTRALTSPEAQSIYLVGQNGQSYDTVAPINVSVRKNGGAVQVIWQAGTLQWADDVTGPWSNVPSATPPYYYYTPGPGASKKFFRVQ